MKKHQLLSRHSTCECISIVACLSLQATLVLTCVLRNRDLTRYDLDKPTRGAIVTDMSPPVKHAPH
jgi:hypothetical protein